MNAKRAPKVEGILDCPPDNDWTFDHLHTFDRELGRLAAGFGLDTYPNQIEVIRADQMLDAYASIGMPLGYHH